MVASRLDREDRGLDTVFVDLCQLGENVLCTLLIGPLFGSNRLIEFALQAVADFAGESPLSLAAAERSGEPPASGPPFLPPLTPSVRFSVAAGQTPSSLALAPPGSRPHFLNSQQFCFPIDITSLFDSKRFHRLCDYRLWDQWNSNGRLLRQKTRSAISFMPVVAGIFRTGVPTIPRERPLLGSKN